MVKYLFEYTKFYMVDSDRLKLYQRVTKLIDRGKINLYEAYDGLLDDAHENKIEEFFHDHTEEVKPEEICYSSITNDSGNPLKVVCVLCGYKYPIEEFTTISGSLEDGICERCFNSPLRGVS